MFTSLGAGGSSGPIKVRHNGKVLPICQLGYDYGREAVVICRQLGYVGGWVVHHMVYVESDFLEMHCATGGKSYRWGGGVDPHWLMIYGDSQRLKGAFLGVHECN